MAAVNSAADSIFRTNSTNIVPPAGAGVRLIGWLIAAANFRFLPVEGRTIRSCTQPLPLRHGQRIEVELLPPCAFVAALVELTMVSTAERHRELVADFAAQLVTPLSKSLGLRDPDHLKFVRIQACFAYGRSPSDAHHLKFAQQRALGRKVTVAIRSQLRTKFSEVVSYPRYPKSVVPILAVGRQRTAHVPVSNRRLQKSIGNEQRPYGPAQVAAARRDA